MLICDFDLQDQCGDVLMFLAEPNPEEEFAEFSDVYYGVYSIVEHIIEENDAVPGRPRLTYFEDERILLVEKFGSMHEAPFCHLQSIFSSFLYGSHLRDCSVDTSVSRVLGLMSASAIPDLLITMNVMTEDDWIHEVLVIGECAFAQDTNSVLRKIKYEIASHPEVLMVIMIVIDEHHAQYRSPGRMSEAWQILRRETSTLSRSSFHSLRGATARSLKEPIVVAGHTWCHLESVRFHVWVRGDEAINVDVDNELLARGTLFPNQEMGAVDAMIDKGMVMMRDHLAAVCQKVAPGSDISALRDSSVTFRPEWNRLLRDLMRAVDDTAYDRYRSWCDSPP
ncbi:uncharacterized protein BJ212DRAFT_490309 [Suillus subaureus]|uniref:Uncharacterized protein n=1 Tax=Suillus subaureus TaxID=48587 RepID=A0A9P7E5F6_9AGAM|nr:uncharacterized protein BJ212DRAFT_490309 [Suillus subaureus]KAG1811794.1 hypothetical protein BJ212DRAFT_490309 [Suillus subaureus]